MFVRKKKNRSGTISVVIVDKSSGGFTELKVIGVGNNEDEINELVLRGKDWIAHYGGQQSIDFEGDERRLHLSLAAAEALTRSTTKPSLNAAM